MNRLFPVLLAYVFLQAQAFALSGGPVFPNGDTTTTIGTFAGVLTPASDPTLTAVAVTNSLGVFSLGVPSVNVASGNFVYFTEGRTYVGAILGVADPDRATFSGLVKAQFNVSINITDVTFGDASISFPAGYANGSIECEIGANDLGGANASLALAIRIEGTSTLSVQSADVDTGQPTGPITSLVLNVDGFKQSVTADVSADLNAFGLSSSTAAGATTGG